MKDRGIGSRWNFNHERVVASLFYKIRVQFLPQLRNLNASDGILTCAVTRFAAENVHGDLVFRNTLVGIGKNTVT
jgi:hypothetical protein